MCRKLNSTSWYQPGGVYARISTTSLGLQTFKPLQARANPLSCSPGVLSDGKLLLVFSRRRSTLQPGCMPTSFLPKFYLYSASVRSIFASASAYTSFQFSSHRRAYAWQCSTSMHCSTAVQCSAAVHCSATIRPNAIRMPRHPRKSGTVPS